MIIPNYLSP